jgi:hypothetical protein
MSSIIDRFFDIEKKIYPGAEYRDKSKVLRHKIIGWYSKPFNPNYLSRVTTTMYPRTDFGSEVTDPMWMAEIEFHENVHKWDFRKGPIRAMMKYLFPQLYALPFIAGAFIAAGWQGLAGLAAFLIAGHVGLIVAHRHLGEKGKVTPAAMKFFGLMVGAGALGALGMCIKGGGWWSLLLAGGALFLSPWPLKAWWRSAYELRGYTASLYQEWLCNGGIRPEALDYCVQQFTGPTYFFMETNRRLVKDRLQFQIDRFVTAEPQFLSYWQSLGSKRTDSEAAEPYRMINEFISREHLRNVKD